MWSGTRSRSPPPFRGQLPWAFNVIEGIERIAAYGARAMDHAKSIVPTNPAGTGSTDPGSRSSGTRPLLSSFPDRSEIAVVPVRR